MSPREYFDRLSDELSRRAEISHFEPEAPAARSVNNGKKYTFKVRVHFVDGRSFLDVYKAVTFSGGAPVRTKYSYCYRRLGATVFNYDSSSILLPPSDS